jgi:hypothetical protein
VQMPTQVELQTNLMKQKLARKELEMLAQVGYMIQTWRCYHKHQLLMMHL